MKLLPRLPAFAVLLLAAALLLSAALLGCGEPSPQRGEAKRIVALAPSNVELLFELGLGARMVGVGDYCAFPAEVSTLPKLGGLVDPNLEGLVALSPDLVVLLPSEDRLGSHLQQLGIETLTVPSDSLADVEAAALSIAERCGVPAAGRELVAKLRRDLAPVDKPRQLRVLVSLERQPGQTAELLSAGPGSFVDELLTRAGVVNLLADAGTPFPKVGLEVVLARDPDFILELAIEKDPVRDRLLLADWHAHPGLAAVRAGRLAVISGSHTVVPGPRLIELSADLRRVLATAGEGR